MARTDNLTNFLKDVAIAIKSKKGDSSPILASNFDDAIMSIPSGGQTETNIYRINSIEERDALIPKEEDICILYGSEQKSLDVNMKFSKIFFNNNISVSLVLVTYKATCLNEDESKPSRIVMTLTSKLFTFQYTKDNGEVIEVTYTKSGSTYVKDTDISYIDLEGTFVSPGTINKNITLFVNVPIHVFGSYMFKNNTWENLNIDIDNATLEKDVIVGTKFYGNDGYGEGTFFNDLQYMQKTISSKFYSKLSSLTSGKENLSHLFEYGYINPEYSKNINTTSAVDMSSMFASMTNSVSDISEYVSNFNTSNVVNMDSMFYYCRGVEQYTITNFDTSKVTNMVSMFRSNSAKKFDLRSFTSESHPDVLGMFNSCTLVEEIDMRNFDFRYLSGDLAWYLPAGCTLVVKDDVQIQWITNNIKVSNDSINIVRPI